MGVPVIRRRPVSGSAEGSVNAYADFLKTKELTAPRLGLEVVPDLADHLFRFQRASVAFGLQRGSWGCYFDTGLGKTACELVIRPLPHPR